MSDPTQQPNANKTEAEELSTLRKLTSELRSKNTVKKARIAELESAATAIQVELAQTKAELKKVTVDIPLRGFAEAISTAPEAFIETLQRDYKVELKDGSLTLLTPTGEPIIHEGKPIPFELGAIRTLLLASKEEGRAQLYRSIIVVSRATGGAANPPSRSGSASTQTEPAQHFGLR